MSHQIPHSSAITENKRSSLKGESHTPMGQVADDGSNVIMASNPEDQSTLPGLGATTTTRGLESAMHQQAGGSDFIDVLDPLLSVQDAFETPCRGTICSSLPFVPSQSHLDETLSGPFPDHFGPMKISSFRRDSRGVVPNPARTSPYPKSKPQDDLGGRNPPTPSRRRDHSDRRDYRDADCSSSKKTRLSISPLRPRNELFWMDLLGAPYTGRVSHELHQYGILGAENYNGPVCFNCCGCHALSCCPQKQVAGVIRRNLAFFRKAIKPTTTNRYCLESMNAPSASMSVEDIVNGINSGDEYQEMIATRAARETLCIESERPPLDILLRIPKLVQFLGRESAPQLQLEAAWSLAIIASGTSEQTKAVVRTGATTKFISLLASFCDNIFSNDFITLTLKTDLVEPAMWALGSIAGDGPDLRDYVIEQGITEPLVSLIEHDTWSTLSSVSAWTLSNLCRKPRLSVPTVRKLLPALGVLISNDDPETLHYSCWALAFLTDGPTEIIQEIVEAGLVPRVVSLLDHKDGAVVTPVLKVISRIETTTNLQTRCAFPAGAIPLLAK